MENLYKWTIIAFGLTSSKSKVTSELELAQRKISELESSLALAKDGLLEMFDRSDVSVEELAMKERQFELLSRLFIEKRISLINKIATSCLEGIKSFRAEIEANPSTLMEDSATEKLKCMNKALKYIQNERDLPKRSQEIELFRELKQSVEYTFKFIVEGKQFDKCNKESIFQLIMDTNSIEA